MKNALQLTTTGTNEVHYEPIVRNGSLTIGDTTAQNQALILQSDKGEWKEFPLLGVGLAGIVHDHDLHAWKRSITEQLEADGMRIERLRLSTTALDLKAEYK